VQEPGKPQNAATPVADAHRRAWFGSDRRAPSLCRRQGTPRKPVAEAAGRDGGGEGRTGAETACSCRVQCSSCYEDEEWNPRGERSVKGEGHCTSSSLAVFCCLFSAFILLEGCICKFLTWSIVTFVLAPLCVGPEACCCLPVHFSETVHLFHTYCMSEINDRLIWDFFV
jgi:hypothetical protein